MASYRILARLPLAGFSEINHDSPGQFDGNVNFLALFFKQAQHLFALPRWLHDC
jgi:hypothetical protein